MILIYLLELFVGFLDGLIRRQGLKGVFEEMKRVHTRWLIAHTLAGFRPRV